MKKLRWSDSSAMITFNIACVLAQRFRSFVEATAGVRVKGVLTYSHIVLDPRDLFRGI